MDLAGIRRVHHPGADHGAYDRGGEQGEGGDKEEVLGDGFLGQWQSGL